MRGRRDITPNRLRKLWTEYTKFQTPQLTPSTIQRDYHKVDRLLGKMPNTLTTAIEIRDWLLQHYAAESTRRIIQQLNGLWLPI